jgi:hypothetical protein
MSFKFLIPLFFFISFYLKAVEIDDVLTVKILNVSSTKKTILINRGMEDGLAENQHAKYFITQGVVARGVLVKLMPQKSVWSLYRLVNPSEIEIDKALKIKITEAVKLASDETRLVEKTNIPVSANGDTALEDSSIPVVDSDSDDSLKDLFDQEDTTHNQTATLNQSLLHRNWEVWGALSLDVRSFKADSTQKTIDYTNTLYHFTLGAEYYFKNIDRWYSSFSFAPLISLTRSSDFSLAGGGANSSRFDFGGMLHWHPSKKQPWMINSFIPFFSLGFSLGKVRDGVSYIDSTTQATVNESLNGSSKNIALGVGFKFYTSRGFGARMILDYNYTIDTFGADALGVEWTKKSSGPRIWAGMSYRF